MTDIPPHQGSPQGEEAAEGHTTVADEIRAFIGEARETASAEFAYQAARVEIAGKIVVRIVGLAALALALIFFALMALVVGLLLGLLTPLGAWGATAAVVLGLLITAGLSVLLAWLGWRRLRRLFLGKGS